MLDAPEKTPPVWSTGGVAKGASQPWFDALRALRSARSRLTTAGPPELPCQRLELRRPPMTQQLARYRARTTIILESGLAVHDDPFVTFGALHPAPFVTGEVVRNLQRLHF